VGYIDFKVICVTKNSNTFQKTMFWKEKSVEDMVTIGPTAQAALYLLKKVVCLVVCHVEIFQTTLPPSCF
jgi:hypothetical protein